MLRFGLRGKWLNVAHPPVVQSLLKQSAGSNKTRPASQHWTVSRFHRTGSSICAASKFRYGTKILAKKYYCTSPPLQVLRYKLFSTTACRVFPQRSQQLPENMLAALWGWTFRRGYIRAPRSRKVWYVLGLVVLALSGVVHYYKHIDVNPLTGRRRYVCLSEWQIGFIADYITDELNRKAKVLDSKDKEVRLVVECVEKIVAANRNITKRFDDINWKISVLNDSYQFAHTYANGHIYISLGMIKVLGSRDNIAFVLAHEMAHVLMSHKAERISYGNIMEKIMMGAVAACWSLMRVDFYNDVFVNLFVPQMLADVSEYTASLPFYRMQEREADLVGAEMASRACFDTREFIAWMMWVDYDEQRSDKKSGPEYLSTHPVYASRIEYLKENIKKNEELYQAESCPNWHKENPIRRMQQKIDRNKLMTDMSQK